MSFSLRRHIRARRDAAQRPTDRDPAPGARQRPCRGRGAGRHLRGDDLDDPARPERPLPERAAGAGAWRGGAGGAGRERDLCRAAGSGGAGEARDRPAGGGADSRRLLGHRQRRHHDRGGGAGAGRPARPGGGDQQPQRGRHPVRDPGQGADHRRRHGAAVGRRGGRRRGGGVHPALQGGLRGDRRLGARRGRGDPRLRHARGGGGAGDRRERPPDDPGRRPDEVRAQRAGADLRRRRHPRLRHRRRRRRWPSPRPARAGGVEIAIAESRLLATTAP